MNFQRRLAASPISLHTIVMTTMVLWLIIEFTSKTAHSTVYDMGDLGWWNSLPSFFRNGRWGGTVISLLTVVASIYMIAELNVTFVLLRINSRVMSIVLSALMLGAVSLHPLSNGMLAMPCVLFSYFSLFRSYQMEHSSGLIYVTFLYLSLASLVVPKLLLLIPFYWWSVYIMRSNNVKSICASVIGVLTPYWIVGATAYYKDRLPFFWERLSQSIDFRQADYSAVCSCDWVMLIFCLLLFLVSTFDFLTRLYMDKNHTRDLYFVVIIHSTILFLLIFIQPYLCHSFLPLVILLSSLMTGHYITGDSNGMSGMSVSNIVVGIMAMAAVTIIIVNSWIL